MPTSLPFSLAGKRVWVAGHRGMVGSALVRRLAERRLRSPDRRPRRRRPDTPGRDGALGFGSAAGRHLPRRGKGRRHSRQRHVSGRFPLRQPDDRGEHPGGGASRARRQGALPRIELHLSEIRRSADRRGFAPDRPARTDKRVVCDRQDRRHEARRGLSPAARRRLHLRHADQSLRAGGQFRSEDQPCPAGADPQGARGERRAATTR